MLLCWRRCRNAIRAAAAIGAFSRQRGIGGVPIGGGSAPCEARCRAEPINYNAPPSRLPLCGRCAKMVPAQSGRAAGRRRTTIRAIGAAGAQDPYKVKVGGSNPSSPTIETAGHRAVRPVASLFSAVAVPRFHGRSAAVAGSAALAFKQMLPVVSQTERLRARAAFDRQLIQCGASLFDHGTPGKSARSSATSSPCPLFDAKREGRPSASRISNAGDPLARNCQHAPAAFAWLSRLIRVGSAVGTRSIRLFSASAR